MNNANAFIKFENNRLMLSGDLDFVSVMPIWEASLTILPNVTEWVFDLSEIKSVKSAGIALLVEWLRLAKQQNKVVHFQNVPVQLVSIAKACNFSIP